MVNESDGVLERVEEPRKQVESRRRAQTGALMQDTVKRSRRVLLVQKRDCQSFTVLGVPSVTLAQSRNWRTDRPG